jgi:hypothetical protein
MASLKITNFWNVTLKMETASSSETLVGIYQAKWHPIQEDSSLDIYRVKLKKSNMISFSMFYDKYPVKNLLYL